jgi:CxxC motif-containing protein (DUF1111 family)
MNGRSAAALVSLMCVLTGAALPHAREDERGSVDQIGVERIGGETTVFDAGPHAYGRMLANLDPMRWSEARIGKQRFVQHWPQHGPSAIASACVDCHYRNGRGPKPHSAPISGTPSGRIGPAVFGLGLIEAIPEDAILAHADPQDADGDGISGRAQRVRDPATGREVLGRFGWKAAKPSIAAQSATALAQELGVTGSDADVAALVRYVKALAVPARRDWTAPTVREGERLFADIGCSRCHRPDIITTGKAPGWPELSGQAIRPYTDLLLHDMGPALADSVTESAAAADAAAGAAASEWRTPPLWGLGLAPIVNGEIRLLHDGRARSFEEAILWHAGEAASARDRFSTLPRARRDALMTFLASL